jgi:hypothetical protein
MLCSFNNLVTCLYKKYANYKLFSFHIEFVSVTRSSSPLCSNAKVMGNPMFLLLEKSTTSRCPAVGIPSDAPPIHRLSLSNPISYSNSFQDDDHSRYQETHYIHENLRPPSRRTRAMLEHRHSYLPHPVASSSSASMTPPLYSEAQHQIHATIANLVRNASRGNSVHNISDQFAPTSFPSQSQHAFPPASSPERQFYNSLSRPTAVPTSTMRRVTAVRPWRSNQSQPDRRLP